MEIAPGLNKVFGDQLRLIRRAAGITQEELAFRAGLDRTYISLLERGIKSPTLHTFFRLCSVLDQKPEEFVAQMQKALEQTETSINSQNTSKDKGASQ